MHYTVPEYWSTNAGSVPWLGMKGCASLRALESSHVPNVCMDVMAMVVRERRAVCCDDEKDQEER